MNLNLIDWQWIFHTKTHNFILIKIEDKNFIKFWKKNGPDILSVNDFTVLIPLISKQININEIIQQYKLTIKNFLDSKSKTLIIERKIFEILIQDDKKINFLKFLSKKNKNIVFFYSNDSFLENFNFIKDSKVKYNVLNLNEEKFMKLINAKKNFLIIKNDFKNLNSIFKNPFLLPIEEI